MSGEHKVEWALEGDKEFRKLVTATEGTIRSIHRHQIPEDRRKDIASYNPQVREKIKDGVHARRVRGIIGGERVNYPGATAARTASPVRSLLNSILCDDAEWSAAEIADYYLNTPLLRPEYMRMTRSQISPTIMAECDLEQCFDGDIMHSDVNKNMYSLSQAGLHKRRHKPTRRLSMSVQCLAYSLAACCPGVLALYTSHIVVTGSYLAA
jgi:DNA-binding MarR family transcriptional regulator